MVYYNPAVHKDTSKATGAPVNPGSVSGFGGLAYESPWQLDKKYWTTGNTGSVQYQKAAGQILQGAESADAAMLKAYRDMYRARLGGAAAGQRQYMDQQTAESAGMGLSPDLVRRMLANRQAGQSQMLGAAQGELQGQYGLSRAPLLQQTGNALAGLLVDETKFGLNYASGKRAANNAQIAGGIGAIAGIGGAALGGYLGGMGGGAAGGGAGQQLNYTGYQPTSGYNGYQGMLPPGSY